ncbi:hypothetical protein FQZ97_695290 [compost metagenome]
MKLAKGQLLILSTGRYSGYDFTGPYVCLSDIDLESIEEAVKALSKEEMKWRDAYMPYPDQACPEDITGYLLAANLISKVECTEINLGQGDNINIKPM